MAKKYDYNDPSRYEVSKKPEPTFLPIPNVFIRVLSIVIDFVLIAILTVGFAIAQYFIFMKPNGYQEKLEYCDKLMEDSGLFSKNEMGLDITLNEVYTTSGKTAIEVYDEKLSTFFKTFDYCIQDDVYGQFLDSKINSGLFNEQFEVVEGVEESDLSLFYSNCYNIAYEYFIYSEDYYNTRKEIALSFTWNAILSTFLSTGIFYLLIPLLRDEGETVGQMICKICVCNHDNNGKPGKGRIFVRFIVSYTAFFFFNILLYYLLGQLNIITIFINVIIMAISKKSRGIQDFLSITYVIRKDRMDKEAMLKNVFGKK